MKKQEFASRLRQEMDCAHVSPQLKRRTLDAVEGKEPMMKKKLSAAAVLALLAVMICAAAIAAATRAGLLDFIGQYANIYIPEDAQTYVQTDVLTMENELVTVNVDELYYDGHISRMIVSVTPKDQTTMLLGCDMALEDRWQNMLRLNGEWDETDTRTALDVYRAGGYQAAYAVDTWLWPDEGETTGGSGDYNLGEDGTLTLYSQVEYEEAKSERGATFRLYLTPYQLPLSQESHLVRENQIVMELPLVLREADFPSESYVSTEPVDYPSVGVRVERLLIEVKAHEIHATVDFTVTDQQTYDKLDGGLGFEFINPDIVTDQPYAQRLTSGMSGTGSVGPVGVNLYRQTETLGRNELHDIYTLRAYDCWEKDRFETHTFTMKPVTE